MPVFHSWMCLCGHRVYSHRRNLQSSPGELFLFILFFPVLFNNTAHSSKMFLMCSCIVRDIDIAGNSGACPSQMGDFLLCHGEAF